MAKVTFGPIVSEARNKVGGVVFSRNPHGAYSRTWLVPTNPNTTAQAAVRLSMRELSQRWATALSDEQRAAWRSLGKLYPHIDVFRQKSIRPGLQTYLRSNLALASIGSGPLDDAPRKLSASDPQQVTATAVSGAPPTITVNCDSPPAINEAVQIWVSPALSTGRSYFYKYMRLVATFTAGTAGPWDPSGGWSARFTTLAFPAKLGIGVRYVNVETGATGPMRTALITATEGDTDVLRSIDFALTAADILALPSTPFELLPAPGAGILAMPLYAFLRSTKTADAYTNVGDRITLLIETGGAQLLAALFDDPVGGFNTCSLFLNTGTINGAFLIQPPRGPFSTDQDQYCSLIYGGDPGNAANQPTNIRIANYDSPSFNDLGDLTGGDPSNIITGTLYYVLQTI